MQNKGLNGWFGRFLKKAIQKVAEYADNVLGATPIGMAIQEATGIKFAELTQDIGSGGSSFWNKTTTGSLLNENYEPTASEEIILDRFVDNFKLIVANLTQYAESINANPNVATKIQMLNYLNQRIGVIIYYYRNNELNGLSSNAIALREAVMQPFFDVIKKIPSGKITQGLTQSEITVMVNSGSDIPEFSPVPTLTKTSFSAKYTVYKSANEVTNPKGEDLIITDVIDNTQNQVLNPTDSNTTATPEIITDKKNSWLGWLLLGVGIIGVSKLAKKKK